MRLHFVAMLPLLAAAGMLSPVAGAAQAPVRLSVVGGLSLPVGDLGAGADLGFSLALRAEGAPVSPGWALRGDFSVDRYDGRRGVDSYSYLALAGNFVHRGRNPGFYQYAGLGVYNSQVAFANATDRSDTDLGVQAGLGTELTRDRRVFGEFGFTGVFTSGRSSLWFPVRVGLRF
jgi:hypothetical protein